MDNIYRNWTEICNVGHRNNLLMLVLASVSIDENDPIFTGLYCGFPQCFSDKETDGPFPLSVLRELGGEAAVQSGRPWQDGADHPDAYGVIMDLSVPHTIFQVDDDHSGLGVDWPFFPMKLEDARKLKQGNIFVWHGKKLVVLECRFNDKNEEHVVVASPVECIDLDI